MKTTAKIIVTLLIGTFFSSQAQVVSEREIKININEINGSLEKIDLLTPITYNYNTEKFKNLPISNQNRYGFLVETVQTVFPDMIYSKYVQYSAGKNHQKNIQIKEVDNESLVPLLVASIKELYQEVERLKNEISMLKKEIN